MSFFSDIIESVKKKSAEMKERKEFLNLVEEKAKPIRRAAYMNQMFREVVSEGIAKAKADSEARKPQPQKTEQDFGIKLGLEDPLKYLKPKETKLKEKKK